VDTDGRPGGSVGGYLSAELKPTVAQLAIRRSSINSRNAFGLFCCSVCLSVYSATPSPTTPGTGQKNSVATSPPAEHKAKVSICFNHIWPPSRNVSLNSHHDAGQLEISCQTGPGTLARCRRPRFNEIDGYPAHLRYRGCPRSFRANIRPIFPPCHGVSSRKRVIGNAALQGGQFSSKNPAEVLVLLELFLFALVLC
jgi:hypothetical protein